MNVILIPGLWLDASTWDAVEPSLRAAGHTTRALTLPGVGASAADSSDIGIADWVDAVVEQIDASPGPVALVGHSGGGNVAWGAADARPGRVSRVVFVDTIPPHPGGTISEFPIVEGVIPFPGWDFFDADDTADLDDDVRAATAPRTRSVPARVPTDPLTLSDERRFDVPVTLLMGQLDEPAFRSLVANWGPFGDEFGAIRDSEVIRLDTAHWPQFSQPERLTRTLVAVLG